MVIPVWFHVTQPAYWRRNFHANLSAANDATRYHCNIRASNAVRNKKGLAHNVPSLWLQLLAIACQPMAWSLPGNTCANNAARHGMGYADSKFCAKSPPGCLPPRAWHGSCPEGGPTYAQNPSNFWDLAAIGLGLDHHCKFTGTTCVVTPANFPSYHGFFTVNTGL